MVFAKAAPLQPDEISEFTRSKLSFKTKSGSYGYMDDFGWYSGIDYDYWIGYQGFERVSEPRFFEIAGYTQEAKKAKKYHQTKTQMMVGGIISMVAGSLLLSSMHQDDHPYNEALGTILTATGGIAFSVGTFMAFNNRYPSNIAQMVADDFNDRLIQQIRK
jgi:hypothetical protein